MGTVSSIRRWQARRLNETDILTEEECAMLRGFLRWKINNKRAMDAADAGLPAPAPLDNQPTPAGPPKLRVVRSPSGGEHV